METIKSKVYIQMDEKSRILRCEGGYTMGNITDTVAAVLDMYIPLWLFINFYAFIYPTYLQSQEIAVSQTIRQARQPQVVLDMVISESL